jgi:acetolactate synthase I/II/III large subunit
MKLTGGEAVGRTLKSGGVDVVFGLVGHGNIGLIDGIVKSGIEFVSCHHETIAGMAADGYFRATGKPGVVCLTCAPGALNAQLAIATAAQDHSAVIYIVGDIPVEFAGKGTYEEVDLNGPDTQFDVLRPSFKRAWKVTNLSLVSQFVANAFNAATTGCPGPVLLDIPFDLQTQETDAAIAHIPSRLPTGKPQGQDDQVKRSVDLLLHAKRPVLFVGGGAGLAGASDEVMALSELLDIPIVSSIMGAASLAGNYAGYAGFIGSYGTDLANTLVREADLVLAVGTRFEEEETAIWLDGEVFRVPPTRLLQIDIDPTVIGKNYPVEIGIVGDARLTLRRFVEVAAERIKGKVASEGRLNALVQAKEQWLARLMPAMISDARPINPRRVLYALRKHMGDDAIVTVDPSWTRVGLLQQLGGPGQGRCFIVGGVLPIGWSTAAALGVAAGRKPSRVVAITGDGGFLLNVPSLLTAVEHDLPITWLIINNGGYNALDVLQRFYFGGRSVGSRFLSNSTNKDVTPDFATVARGFHIPAERVEDPGEIDQALKRALQSTGPYLLDVITDPDESRLIRTASVTWTYFWSRQRAKGTSELIG